MKKVVKLSAVAACIVLIQGCGNADAGSEPYEYKYLNESVSKPRADAYAKQLARAQQRRNTHQEDQENPVVTLHHQNYAACFLDMFAREQRNHPGVNMTSEIDTATRMLMRAYRMDIIEALHSADPTWTTPEGLISHLHNVCEEEVGNPYDDDGL